MAQLLQQSQDNDAAGAVDRQPRAMQRASVDESAFGDKRQHHFPCPADEAEDKEQHHQIEHSVIALRIQLRARVQTELHPCRGKTARIGEPMQDVLGLGHAVEIGLILLPCVHAVILPDCDAEPVRHPPGKSGGCRHCGTSGIYGGRAPHHIGIRVVQQFGGRLCIQVFVAQPFRSLDPGALGRGTQLHVIFGEECGVIPVGIENRRQSERGDGKQIPSQETQLRHKTLPLVAFHHTSRETDRFVRADVRILSHDVRNQEV